MAFKRSEEEFDNVAVMKNNFENKFLKDYCFVPKKISSVKSTDFNKKFSPERGVQNPPQPQGGS